MTLSNLTTTKEMRCLGETYDVAAAPMRVFKPVGHGDFTCSYCGWMQSSVASGCAEVCCADTWAWPAHRALYEYAARIARNAGYDVPSVPPHRMPDLYIPTITFSDDAIDSAIQIMHALVEFVVDLEIPDNTGYPNERVCIVRIDQDGDVVVSETDEFGRVIRNATWAVPVNLIKKVTVL